MKTRMVLTYVLSVCLIAANLTLFVGAASNHDNNDIGEAFQSATEFNGKYYKVFDDMNMTWTEADAYCRSLGGHLVTITSESEQTFVTQLIKDHNKNFYWLGGYEEQDTWVWVSGEAFTYSNWETGQPDNHDDEDYLMIYNKVNIRNDLYTWNDIREDGIFPNEDFWGTHNSGFICEWDNVCISGDLIYATHQYGDWTVIIEASCLQEGHTEHKCVNCGYVEKLTIEKKSHEFSDWSIISGSKLIPPIVKARSCQLCDTEEQINDWSYIWVTILAGVVVIGSVLGVINYIRAFKNR